MEYQKERKEKGAEKIFELIMVRNCPKLITDPKPHSKETQRMPSRKIPNIHISSLSISYLNCRKLKTKKILKSEGK